NFLEIIHYKKQNPYIVELLLGNHDFQYLPLALAVRERYSGFQEKQAWNIRNMFEEYKDLFEIAHLHAHFLFTHAGVTNTWMQRVADYRKDDLKKVIDNRYVDSYINETFKYAPGLF